MRTLARLFSITVAAAVAALSAAVVIDGRVPDQPTTVLVIIAGVIAAIVALAVGLHQFGEAVEYLSQRWRTRQPPLSAYCRRSPRMSLLIFVLVGACIGAAVGSAIWGWLKARPASIAAARPSEPPLYVTRVEVIGPFIVGEKLNTRIHIFNKRAGGTIRASGSARFVEISGGGFDEHRQAIEDEVVWLPVLTSPDLIGAPGLINLPEGAYSLGLAPMTLQPHNVEAIQNGTAIVYLAGQIDYGDGALDYCYMWRPDGTVKPCLGHNGPAEKRAY